MTLTTPAPDIFPSRYAQCMFWLSRYMERVESLATLLDVTHTFSPASRNAQNWQSVLTLHYDEEAFAQRYLKLTAGNVIRFYLVDDSHPNSIMSVLQQVRLNASQLRPLISIEMWVQINRMWSATRELGNQPITPQDLSHVLSTIRTQCQTFAGITDGGLYRDQGWWFYLLGKHLERADQTTRLLDIKYHLLLPSLDVVGSTIDASQWFSVLRAASGYYAFRREYPYIVNPTTVAGFLLLDRRFPRSVAACIETIGYALEKLRERHNLPKTDDVIALNQTLSTQLRSEPIESIITQGLHEYLDQIQLRLMEMSGRVGQHFF